MDFFNFVAFLGGLGLFLFGMKTMGDGLEKAAGGKMRKLIEAMTSNVYKGVIIGAVVTAIIQSSSATTVMVVGFVNAGIMKLTQAVGVIMGANIGTTVTAQILRLGDIDKNSWYLQLLKPKAIAPLAVAIGVTLILFSKKKKYKNFGEILSGFGILFMGMSTMENAVKVLRDLPQFEQAFIKFGQYPILGVLVGAAVTAIIQSSSASVGILQAVAASTGMVTFSSAVPIILGQNIGTCVTALLSGIGANKNAKKAAIIHLFFNIIGTTVFLIGIYLFQAVIGFSFWNNNIGRGGIANFHAVFNITNTVILMPFAPLLVRLANITVRGKERYSEQEYLDDRFLATPSVAVSQSEKEVIRMAEITKNNVLLSFKSILNKDIKSMDKIEENENMIDEMESNITQYLVKLSDLPLNKQENKLVSGMFHVVTDIERIGDHAVNLIEIAELIYNENINFSDSAKRELNVIIDAVSEILNLTVGAYRRRDKIMAMRIQPCEDIIDLLKETLKIRHMNRLTKQKCDFKPGVIFLDIINNLERIADHCSNIGISVEQFYSDEVTLDAHKYLKQVHQQQTQQYKEIYSEYERKYQNLIN